MDENSEVLFSVLIINFPLNFCNFKDFTQHTSYDLLTKNLDSLYYKDAHLRDDKTEKTKVEKVHAPSRI